MDKLQEFYAQDVKEGKVQLLYGVREIYSNLLASLRKVRSYAIQDDYSYWAAKKESAAGGKLLLIDETDYGTHQIFFDDNIGENPIHSILDVRDLTTGEPVSYGRAMNKFIVQVESSRAILEDDYFIKKVEECEQRRAEEIESIEHIAQLSPCAEKEWAALGHFAADEYLSKTVLPTVYQGLKEIGAARPADPVKAFAQFLLRSQSASKKAK